MWGRKWETQKKTTDSGLATTPLPHNNTINLTQATVVTSQRHIPVQIANPMNTNFSGKYSWRASRYFRFKTKNSLCNKATGLIKSKLLVNCLIQAMTTLKLWTTLLNIFYLRYQTIRHCFAKTTMESAQSSCCLSVCLFYNSGEVFRKNMNRVMLL